MSAYIKWILVFNGLLLFCLHCHAYMRSPGGASCGPDDNEEACRRMPYDEQYRLQYHFSPQQNWMNDPCGLIYYGGVYHLFYQYNPYGNTWGNMHWGHAASNDLVHWLHLPIAIPEEEGVMIFTGTSVYDVNNTSGFGDSETPPIVAVYTGSIPSLGNRQDQRLAFSLDAASTWTKYSGNPVLDIGSSEFRDPMVFWYEPAQQWRMVIAMSVDHVVRIYSSVNLVDWQLLSDFGDGEPGRIWECPNMFPLPVDGNGSDMKWVLEVAVNGFEAVPAVDFGIQYFIGDFNGTHFLNDNSPTTILWADQSRDFYAPQSWSNMPQTDTRRVWIGWFTYPEYAGLVPVSPWRGSQTIPRVLSLRTTSSGIRLCQTPVEELQSIRQGQSWSYTALSIQELQNQLVANNVRGNTLELAMKLTPTSTSASFGIRILKDDTYETVIGLNRTDDQYVAYADTTKAGVIFSNKFPDVYQTNVDPDETGALDLHIYVDWSSVEAFFSSGCGVFNLRMFPDTNPDGVEVFGDEFTLDFYAYELVSIW